MTIFQLFDTNILFQSRKHDGRSVTDLSNVIKKVTDYMRRLEAYTPISGTSILPPLTTILLKTTADRL